MIKEKAGAWAAIHSIRSLLAGGESPSPTVLPLEGGGGVGASAKAAMPAPCFSDSRVKGREPFRSALERERDICFVSGEGEGKVSLSAFVLSLCHHHRYNNNNPQFISIVYGRHPCVGKQLRRKEEMVEGGATSWLRGGGDLVITFADAQHPPGGEEHF